MTWQTYCIMNAEQTSKNIFMYNIAQFMKVISWFNHSIISSFKAKPAVITKYFLTPFFYLRTSKIGP